jgi:hypothetical protein
MTNTLHRFGSADSFRDDYIVIAMCSRGRNDQGALPKLKRFLEIAREFGPVNLGDARHGGALRPSRSLNPLSHWHRDATRRFDEVVNGLDTPTTVSAVFDNRESAEAFLTKIRAADLGLSVNVSTSIDGGQQTCEAAGVPRHSVGYSLGFEGHTDRLPGSPVLMLSTMCGHGMVAATLAQKMADWVKEGRRTPEQAATYMARFCSCGIFNTERARRILEDVRSGSTATQ